MLITSKLLIFLPTLILGTILTLSSSSWFAAWMGLEINLMSIAPILINKMTYPSVEASIKYFMVQAIASTILILFVTLSASTQPFSLSPVTELVFSLMLLLKAGAAPLHFWFPQVIACSAWPQCILVLTWQKIAPLVMLCFLNNSIIYLAIFTSAVIGALGGINQTNIKLILVYSSMIHSSWMMSLIMTHEMAWLMYFVTYAMLTLSVSYLFIQMNSLTLNSFYAMKMPWFKKIILLVNMLSIAGMPPFLGFVAKAMALTVLLKSSFTITLITVMVAASFLAFYFYMRVMYTILFASPISPHFFNLQITLSTSILMFFPSVSILGSFMIPMLLLAT
uniref:NADH dehydrogenase subunit 2 n=1 Tax=Anurida maritima TaxID=64695 RepID=UPI0022FD7429|nr:NADH dehydrogenase subunit 2 [Anurida maritima]WBK17668.1 NADH dehydrogenase subunit 2 [Anurida maritima]